MDKIDQYEEIQEETTEDTQESTEDSTYWEAEAKKYKRIAEQRLKKLETKEAPKEEKPKKSDDKLEERLDKMALQVAGIKEADEVELFNKWKEQTGREADDIVGNEIFTKELQELRTARTTLEATSDIKGESGESGAKNTADYWIAKATKGDDGQLRFPEETPKELYSKILDKLAANETKSSDELSFYNS